MALSTIIKRHCPFCFSCDKERSHFDTPNFRIITWECGHTSTEKKLSESDTLDTQYTQASYLRKLTPYPFQVTGIKAAIKSNARFLFADEMGLGKTIQALYPIRLHPEELSPFVVFCKASLLIQWWETIIDILGIPFTPQIIKGGEKPIPGFKAYIISLDLLPRCTSWLDSWTDPKLVIIDECQLIKNPGAKRTQIVRNFVAGKRTRPRQLSKSIPERKKIEIMARDLISYHGVSTRFELNFEDIGEKKLGLCECYATKEGIIKGRITINVDHALHASENDILETILHEIAHAITPGAGHRPIWRDTAVAIGSNGESTAHCEGTSEILKEISHPIQHIMALSGTPFKNHVGEYFTILNILRPERFPNLSNFYRDWVDVYSDGKIGGIKHYRIDAFKNLTKDFIIRRTREEVMPDLPKINRMFKYVDFNGDIGRSYGKAMGEFNDVYDNWEESENKFASFSCVLEAMTKLKHIAGIGKVENTVDHAMDFLSSTDRKLTIFVHHKDVGSMIKMQMTDFCKENGINPPLIFTSAMSPEERADCVREFEKPENRLLIASELAGGEGINLQFCSDAFMTERQWNPANEEQAEGRFSRIGSVAKQVNVTYMTAVGTIDELLMEIVERKREIIKSTLDGQIGNWNESEVLKELAEELRKKGMRKWQMN